jgi:mannose-6-phosphate isomerase
VTDNPRVQLLDGVVQHYEWGSSTSLPDLLGRPADGRPWAEIWFGAHPSAPSSLGCAPVPLDAAIAADPIAALGAEVAARFDGALPFLLKVLAAGAPLSLQSHPSIAQAIDGFDREDTAGIPVDAPHRSFKDRNHKPELICALTPFDALCGFRDPGETLEVLGTIDTPALDGVRASVQAAADGATGLDELLRHLLTLDPADAAALTEPVVAACRQPSAAPHADVRALAVQLGERYPGDAGIVTALLLNLVHLQPGEALFLGAGNLHAYLQGTGVEIMANSDNVLRGGLTPKHVDVATLLDIVEARPLPVEVQRPPLADGAAVYRAPVPEFSLVRHEVDGIATVSGPAILLCTEGVVDAAGQTLDRGAAAWLPSSAGTIELDGRATVFVAGVGQPASETGDQA